MRGDIHQEQPVGNVRDGQLWRKMMRFARPYRHRIVLAMVLAALTVAAVVAQPKLIQTAIDDHINGLYKPMVALDAAQASGAGAAGIPGRSGEAVEWNGRLYVRVEDGGGSADRPAGAAPARIVRHGSAHYLIDGWSGEADRLVFTGSGADAAVTLDDGTPVAATLLTADALHRFRRQDTYGLIVIAVLFLLTVLASGLLTYRQTKLLADTGQLVIHDIRARLFEHLTRLPTSFYDRNPVGRLVTRVAHDVEALNQLYSQVIVNLAKELFMLVGILGVMVYLDVGLTLISFTVIPLLVVVTVCFKGVIRDAHRRTRALLSRLNAFLAENLSGMSIVQLFTREGKQLERFNELNEAHYRAGVRGMVLNSVFNPAVGFIGNLALALIVWYGGNAVVKLEVSFGVVYAFTVYVRQFFQPLMALSERYTQIQTAMASAERIFELLEEEPAIVSPPGAVKLKEPVRGEIEFDRVWFAYNPGEWVLRDISFHIRPGETVAFVGATGAGKSSIIQLINRFYDVQRGAVRVDGRDVRELDLDDLRRHIGMIQQDPFVFTGTVYDNIRLNRQDIGDEAIRAAVRELNMDAFIERLPQGFETPLGEQGVKLSSGQQQMLAFLRAYVHNPSVLILDEATAHVDTETEQLIQRGLARLSAGRTTLIVAHRLSTIRHADKIIVLHKGRIQEIGNHAELMERGGIYRRLYELQNTERGTVGRPVIADIR